METVPTAPGALTLDQVHAVMSELSNKRPVFHSEADFQHAFAQLLAEKFTGLDVRLEMPYRAIGSPAPNLRTVVDLYCREPAGEGVTAIEFKYRTREWHGNVPGEKFRLLDHSATDLGRRDFVHDIERLERWSQDAGGTAFAILLTNDDAYWSAPNGRLPTNDAAFRIHEGVTLFGELRWAKNLYPENAHTLTGHFVMAWKDYSDLSVYEEARSKGNQLRYVVAAVER
ncbi:hypothetical protein CFK38_06270 [Brachybacterium vulturis]|uniref:Restriction endonuclease n=1 Tax=Brachybacterium vulturis TaxID=2017484 RepID=A0A291GMH8_9MICO|nr:hypothetical protein [Brachybacterium vulturis]ATG51174.1 hypothetical protein CFK38_06270 [Brachybacterium vulturis]